MAKEKLTKNLTKIIKACNIKGDKSIKQLADYLGLGKSTLQKHKSWINGTSGARKYKGARATGSTEKKLEGLADSCEEIYGEIVQKKKVPTPTKPITTKTRPTPKRRWETELIWEGKHGGTNHNIYSERFSATVKFKVSVGVSHTMANKIGTELIKDGLKQAGYPDLDTIVNNWHDASVGTSQTVNAPEQPEYELVQTDSGDSNRIGMQITIPITLSKTGDDIWRKIR